MRDRAKSQKQKNIRYSQPQDIVQALRDAQSGEFVVWTGAGTSVTAGIPTAEGMVDRFFEMRWLRSEAPDEFNKPPIPSWETPTGNAHGRRMQVRSWAIQYAEEVRLWQSKNPSIVLTPQSDNWWMLYSTCLDSLRGRAARQDFIYDVIKRVTKPNKAHSYLAHLMHKKLVHTALTTNFDELLKRALARFEEFPAELDPDSVLELSVKSDFLQIAYLHGKSTSYRQRHTNAEIKKTIRGLKSFLQQLFIRGGLIVVGYRGGDETPMDILMEVLRENKGGPGRGLYWVTLGTDTALLSRRVQELLTFESTYCVPGFAADEFFECISMPTVGQLDREIDGVHSFPLKASAPQLVAEANKRLSTGHYSQAIESCARALESDPSYVQAYVVWGDVLQFEQKFHDAIEKYRSATERDGSIAMAFLGWGKALAQIGADREAIEKYKQAAALDADYRYTYHHWARSLEKIGCLREAREKDNHAQMLGLPRRSRLI